LGSGCWVALRAVGLGASGVMCARDVALAHAAVGVPTLQQLAAQPLRPSVGEAVEVEWPCEAEEGGEAVNVWFRVLVADAREGPKPRFLLRFGDGKECWNSLRRVAWRAAGSATSTGGTDTEKCRGAPAAPPTLLQSRAGPAGGRSKASITLEAPQAPPVPDVSGFVHAFELPEELLEFCDLLHASKDVYGDKTRGDAVYGEPLHGGLVSVLVRREALPQRERELYNSLHRRCAERVTLAWPSWLRRCGGREAKARPSQDLRLLQYSEGATFPAHVDSGWGCQALVYLNEDFQGGCTEFPNLEARYRPRRGTVLLWRSICVGYHPAVPGSMQDHPALHIACPVFGGVKRVVSVHLVVT